MPIDCKMSSTLTYFFLLFATVDARGVGTGGAGSAAAPTTLWRGCSAKLTKRVDFYDVTSDALVSLLLSRSRRFAIQIFLSTLCIAILSIDTRHA